jgi:hypothetical protein
MPIKQQKYKPSIITDILENLRIYPESRRRNVPLFVGNPGMSKTVRVRDFTEKHGLQMYVFTAATRSPQEISGMAMPDAAKQIMTIFDYDTILNLPSGSVLFFDEIWNGNPQILNACLNLLEDRITISGKKLNDLIIIAAANMQGACQRTPQINGRFLIYDLEFDADEWREYIKEKYDLKDSNALSTMCKWIKEETFTGFNYNTPRDLDKNIQNIINNMITPYEDLKKLLENISYTNDSDIDLPLHTRREHKNCEKYLKYVKPGEKYTWLEEKQTRYQQEFWGSNTVVDGTQLELNLDSI